MGVGCSFAFAVARGCGSRYALGEVGVVQCFLFGLLSLLFVTLVLGLLLILLLALVSLIRCCSVCIAVGMLGMGFEGCLVVGL